MCKSYSGSVEKHGLSDHLWNDPCLVRKDRCVRPRGLCNAFGWYRASGKECYTRTFYARPRYGQDNDFAICLGERDSGVQDKIFSKADIDCYKLDQIMELAIKFTCMRSTYNTDSAYDSQQPYLVYFTRKELGTWLCFACLSGLAQPYTYSEPQATRLIMKEIVGSN